MTLGSGRPGGGGLIGANTNALLRARKIRARCVVHRSLLVMTINYNIARRIHKFGINADWGATHTYGVRFTKSMS